LTAIGRTLAAIVLASACCIATPPVARAQDQVQNPAPRTTVEVPWDKQSLDLARLYDAVVDIIDQKFFDEKLLRRLNWRERTAAVRPDVLSAGNAQAAVARINALLAELKTSHTGLFTPDDYDYYVLLDILSPSPNLGDLIAQRFWGSGPYYPGIGAFTRTIDARHFVDDIMEGSPAERAGLRYGDEIVAVDGKPYSSIAAFRDKIGATVALTIRRDADAGTQQLDVAVVPIRPASAFASATAASARVIERDGSRIGYVHIWASNESISFKAALTKLEPRNVVQDRLRIWGVPGGAPGVASSGKDAQKPLDFLIVDMRGRVGGSMAAAKQNLELLDPKSYWGDWRATGRSAERGGSIAPENPPFRGRSALLIDHHTRSAAEIMAHGYKRSAFGPVIGTPTAGAVTSGALFVMPGDLLLYVAVAGHAFDGLPLEGVGVTPDHEVERPLPYAAGADPVLDAAVELLAKQTPK
jgi:carboxyl-terminal processing protease